MAIDFPNSPTVGQTFTGPNGVIWQWDGVKWIAIPATNPSVGAGNVGRNLLHNALFNVAQRGAGPWTTSVYTLDRWLSVLSNDTVSITQAALNDAIRTAIGDEEAQNCISNTFTGAATAANLVMLQQRIENVRRLAGKVVTISFWAAASAALKIGINMAQYFGTGGSPSATVQALATGNTVTLSAAWTRYSTTITMPSISGKTLGTNGDHSSFLQLWYSSGTTNNATAGNIGAQSGTIQLWGVQLEIGSVATPLEKPDPADDLRKCQRFYAFHYFSNGGYAAVTGTTIYQLVALPTTMRVTPTLVPTYTTQTNCGTSSLSVVDLQSVTATTVNVGGPVNWIFNGSFTASADL